MLFAVLNFAWFQHDYLHLSLKVRSFVSVVTATLNVFFFVQQTLELWIGFFHERRNCDVINFDRFRAG
jgi:hypothetical protein